MAKLEKYATFLECFRDKALLGGGGGGAYVTSIPVDIVR